jgi:HSP20 family molecular chaperone IbpA
MSRMSLFDSPLLLGFEHFERTLDRISKKSAEGYPPYNIEQLDENRLRITLAVAGFSDDELIVEVVDNQLIIQGKRQEEEGDRVYLHRGIAARQFQRAFVLADGIEVRGAELDNGLLHIEVERPEPENRVQRIEIASRRASAIKKSLRKPDLDSG